MIISVEEKEYTGRPIYIFDLDGTLADISKRLVYIQFEHKNWNMFYSSCISDKPIKPMIELAQTLSKTGEVWIVSGRRDSCLKNTQLWLFKNCVPYQRLYMRQTNDFSKDFKLKEEWYNKLSDELKSNIKCVFEDRKSVVDMWRSHDLLCLQPFDGSY